MSPYAWIGFHVFIIIMLALDLGVFNKKDHEISIKEALGFSAMWIALALLFNLGVYHFMGHEQAMAFLTGYVIEKSLSVDNIFVFVMIFSYFKVAPKYQHKVLFWGILGAIIMRAFFIFTGVALLEKFSFMIYIFGAFLIYTGLKMGLSKEDAEVHPENNILIRWLRLLMPVTKEYRDGKFFVRENGVLHATPLLAVILIVESTDLLFAVDSIPAILAISRDTFIIYTSNIFAILGLRALYFAVAAMMNMFTYLKHALSVILVFVGVKMCIAHWYHIPVGVSLTVVLGILILAVLFSIYKNRVAAK